MTPVPSVVPFMIQGFLGTATLDEGDPQIDQHITVGGYFALSQGQNSRFKLLSAMGAVERPLRLAWTWLVEGNAVVVENLSTRWHGGCHPLESSGCIGPIPCCMAANPWASWPCNSGEDPPQR